MPTSPQRYWPQLTKWADYLLEKGLDPENQLSTDDFAGHLAHNANLSIKAILALGCLRTALRNDRPQTGSRALSRESGGVREEVDRDGQRRRSLSPGVRQARHLEPEVQPGLGQTAQAESLPAGVTRKEIAFYETKENKFGLPLDNRKDYTKLDWLIWTATLADNQKDFEKIADLRLQVRR